MEEKKNTIKKEYAEITITEDGMSDINDIFKALLSDDDGNSENKDEENNTPDESGDDIFGGINIDMILKIGEIMSKMNEQDKNTELLLALKPHLRDENRAKMDTAVKLFRLISLLPYLKDSGLFENLF